MDSTHPVRAEFTLNIFREYQEIERMSGHRMWVALMLAPVPAVWYALMRGDPVPEDQLDRDTLRRARQRLRK